jgi:hypothetical protein
MATWSFECRSEGVIGRASIGMASLRCRAIERIRFKTTLQFEKPGRAT